MSWKGHSRIPDYSGNMVSKFHIDWIKIQGEIAYYKNVPRIISLKFRCKINIFGHSNINTGNARSAHFKIWIAGNDFDVS